MLSVASALAFLLALLPLLLLTFPSVQRAVQGPMATVGLGYLIIPWATLLVSMGSVIGIIGVSLSLIRHTHRLVSLIALASNAGVLIYVIIVTHR